MKQEKTIKLADMPVGFGIRVQSLQDNPQDKSYNNAGVSGEPVPGGSACGYNNNQSGGDLDVA